MKKFLSLILALAMVACMSVTAFAADGTTVLTAQIPEAPDYELVIPASTTLDSDKTTLQAIGKVEAKNVSDNIKRLDITMPYTDLVNTEDSTDTIDLKLYCGSSAYPINKDGSFGAMGSWTLYIYDTVNGGTYSYFDYLAAVEDWSGATPGATYQATVTYVVDAIEK